MFAYVVPQLYTIVARSRVLPPGADALIPHWKLRILELARVPADDCNKILTHFGC